MSRKANKRPGSNDLILEEATSSSIQAIKEPKKPPKRSKTPTPKKKKESINDTEQFQANHIVEEIHFEFR